MKQKRPLYYERGGLHYEALRELHGGIQAWLAFFCLILIIGILTQVDWPEPKPSTLHYNATVIGNPTLVTVDGCTYTQVLFDFGTLFNSEQAYNLQGNYSWLVPGRTYEVEIEWHGTGCLGSHQVWTVRAI